MKSALTEPENIVVPRLLLLYHEFDSRFADGGAAPLPEMDDAQDLGG